MPTAVFAAVLMIIGVALPVNAEATAPGCRPQIADVVLPAEKVRSGAEATGTVRLDCAWHRPARIVLASADASWASVPPRLVVPAGETEASFPIQTHQPDYIYGEFNVAITASLHGHEVSRPLGLLPGLKFLVISPLISGDYVSVNIGLNGTAPPGGLTIDMKSDHEALRVSPITIPSGALGVAGRHGESVRIPQDAEVTVTASLPGQSLSTVVTLKAWRYDADWSLTGPTTARGGGGVGLTLELPEPIPHDGVEVTFTSDDEGVSVPSPRVLYEGTSGSVSVRPFLRNDLNGPVTVTAEMEGVGARSHTFRVLPGLKTIEFPWPLYADQTFEGKLHLGTVTDEAVTVALTSDDAALQVPAEVTVPAGASSVAFTGTTVGPVPIWGESATVTAMLDGTRITRDVYVDPPPQ
ncbi:hypothetical protein [Actinomadura sp. WMMB 499]|uniref:hypothetical protein n=1 Tax=Actinomadura sp. WMMB 499 TaxID=1219491 RepID=UPI00124694E8|nr:hypothetical protein [Actinomadura sp. WMMB 499]QFG21380.1 hypothetical protein F7P10_09775 [Actinomadura sp. WMMB 499]